MGNWNLLSQIGGGGYFFILQNLDFWAFLKKILILKVGFAFSNTKGRIPSESENLYIWLYIMQKEL